jgi:pSer/pThr/pTyr-binding forkhead associated (FHA) protein
MTDTWIVGTAEDCDIRIADDPYVSNRHLKVVRDGDRVTVEDLGSMNGTWYEGKARVGLGRPWPVPIGGRIRIGRTDMWRKS